MADRPTIFATIRSARKDQRFLPDEVGLIDDLLDRLGVPRAGAPVSSEPAPVSPAPALRCSRAGIALIHQFEQCHRVRADGLVEAYPDPGTGGAPWTIGWGTTGPDVRPGTVWTRVHCDERFAIDLMRFEREVREAIGHAPTTQNQFDALVSFHYNTGAIARATLTKLHRAGDFAGAAGEFAKWVNAGGRPMKGLVRRRAAEADLYRRTA